MLNLANRLQTPLSMPESALNEVERLDHELLQHFKDKFVVQTSLTRSLVSFQANKTRAVYRWYKYKEAFSASLIEYLFHKYRIEKGKVLDPFAGSGTALFVASDQGMKVDGIELLPIGQQIIGTKKLLESEFTRDDFSTLKRWLTARPWEQSEIRQHLPELRITKSAYPERTRKEIEKYMGACQQENRRVQAVLRFALLCILES